MNHVLIITVGLTLTPPDPTVKAAYVGTSAASVDAVATGLNAEMARTNAGGTISPTTGEAFVFTRVLVDGPVAAGDTLVAAGSIYTKLT